VAYPIFLTCDGGSDLSSFRRHDVTRRTNPMESDE